MKPKSVISNKAMKAMVTETNPLKFKTTLTLPVSAGKICAASTFETNLNVATEKTTVEIPRQIEKNFSAKRIEFFVVCGARFRVTKTRNSKIARAIDRTAII